MSDINDRELELVDRIVNDAKKLYNISEAEYILLTQMASLLSALNYGCELKIKLLKALAFISEEVHEVTCVKGK